VAIRVSICGNYHYFGSSLLVAVVEVVVRFFIEKVVWATKVACMTSYRGLPGACIRGGGQMSSTGADDGRTTEPIATPATSEVGGVRYITTLTRYK